METTVNCKTMKNKFFKSNRNIAKMICPKRNSANATKNFYDDDFKIHHRMKFLFTDEVMINSKN